MIWQQVVFPRYLENIAWNLVKVDNIDPSSTFNVKVYILDFEQGLTGGESDLILYKLPVLNLKLSKMISAYGIQ